MIILSDKEIAELFSHADALASAERAFRALHAGKVDMPPRTAVRVPDHAGTQLCMPCYLRDDAGEVLVVKIVSVFERNAPKGLPVTQAFLQLQDAETGSLLAVMEAEQLTAMRTAAVSVLSAKLLCHAEPTSMLVIGAGMQAQTHIRAMADAFPIESVFVCSRDRVGAAAVCDRLTEELGIRVVPVESPSSCLSKVSLVCLATNSRTPILLGAEVRPGAHVTAIGSFRPDMAEFDGALVRRARVYVDQMEAARRGAGELIQANSWDQVAGELGQLLSGEVAGRSSPEEITLFKSVGLAVQDAAAAAAVYRNSRLRRSLIE